jgi:hypothetical protein
MAIGVLLTLNTVVEASTPSPDEINGNKAFPYFSWNYVPKFAHIGAQDVTTQQLDYLADNYHLVQFTGGTGKAQNVQNIIAKHAKYLKARNPRIKILFYIPSGNARPGREDIYATYPLDNFLTYYKSGKVTKKTKSGKKKKEKAPKSKQYFDILNGEVREWWSDIGIKAVTEYNCDGLIVDGVLSASKENEDRMLAHRKKYPGLTTNKLEQAMKEMLELTLDKMGHDKILSYIAIQGSHKKGLAPRGVQYLSSTNAVWMADYYRNPDKSDAYYLANCLELMRKTAKSGKMVTFKTWPGFRWKAEELETMSMKQKHDLCKKKFVFLLASFLVAAEPYCYFSYTWGWNINHGALLDYPEFHKPLGNPKGDAVRKNWIFTREFEHASVWVDVDKKIGRITWHTSEKK